MSARPAVSSKTHLPALDGLRGVAIALVVVHNLSVLEAKTSLLQKLWTEVVECGWVGVQLFFVLSGFLITGILLDDRDQPRALRTFYARRFLRIFPLYYVFLFGYCFVAAPLSASLHVPASHGVWYWLYLSNWSDLAYGALPGIGHFWSLAVEEQFYLLWPALAMKLRTRAFAIACAGLVVGALAARIAMQAADLPAAWLYGSTISRVDALALGALVALALRSETWRPRLARALVPAGAVAAVGLAIVVARTHGLERLNPTVQTYAYSMLGILFAAAIAAIALDPDRPAARALSWRPLRLLGRYSYAMYVLHFPIKIAVLHVWGARVAAMSAEHPVATDIGFVAALTPVALAAAVVSYYAVERPFLRLKDRWAPRGG